MKRFEFLATVAVFFGLRLKQRRPLSDNPAHVMRDLLVDAGHDVDEASFETMADYLDESVDTLYAGLGEIRSYTPRGFTQMKGSTALTHPGRAGRTLT